MYAYKDTINLIKHFNLKKALNFCQLRWTYFLFKYFKIYISPSHPLSISIEPTTACNLACPECPSGLKNFTRPTGKLTLSTNKEIIDQLYQKLHYINYYFQGEPYLNPDFLELVKYASKKGIFTSTSTNGHFINEKIANDTVNSGLDRLIISIDGSTQETYEQYRKSGKLAKVIKATEHLVKAKKNNRSNTPHLIFQFLAVKPNEHQIPEIFQIAKELDIDEVRIKTAQFYNYEQGNPLMPRNEKYSRYVKKKDGSYKLKGRQGNYCWRMWSGSVFTWDGQLLPCCFDKDAKHSIGNINTQDILSIWRSEKYKKFRSLVFTKRDQIDICNNCSEGSKVWV